MTATAKAPDLPAYTASRPAPRNVDQEVYDAQVRALAALVKQRAAIYGHLTRLSEQINKTRTQVRRAAQARMRSKA